MRGEAPSDLFIEASRTRNPEAIAKADALPDRFRPEPADGKR